MAEKWKAIKGYEGLYEVSDLGRVRSLKRATTSGKVLKGVPDKDGYIYVSLSKNNIKRRYSVHRLVAAAFIQNDNPQKTVINHRNEDKQDNRAENLEWCTVKYNTNYRNMPKRRAEWSRKPIKAIKGNEILHFGSVIDAANFLNASHGNISSCLTHRYGNKTVKGYTFCYE
jgi:hypothetical protein